MDTVILMEVCKTNATILQSVSPQRLLCPPCPVKFKLQKGKMDKRWSHRQTHIDVSADTNMLLFLIVLASMDITEIFFKLLIGPINRLANQLVNHWIIVQVYAPTKVAAEEGKEIYYTQLKGVLDDTSSYDIKLLMLKSRTVTEGASTP